MSNKHKRTAKVKSKPPSSYAHRRYERKKKYRERGKEQEEGLRTPLPLEAQKADAAFEPTPTTIRISKSPPADDAHKLPSPPPTTASVSLRSSLSPPPTVPYEKPRRRVPNILGHDKSSLSDYTPPRYLPYQRPKSPHPEPSPPPRSSAQFEVKCPPRPSPLLESLLSHTSPPLIRRAIDILTALKTRTSLLYPQIAGFATQLEKIKNKIHEPGGRTAEAVGELRRQCAVLEEIVDTMEYHAFEIFVEETALRDVVDEGSGDLVKPLESVERRFQREVEGYKRVMEGLLESLNVEVMKRTIAEVSGLGGARGYLEA